MHAYICREENAIMNEQLALLALRRIGVSLDIYICVRVCVSVCVRATCPKAYWSES